GDRIEEMVEHDAARLTGGEILFGTLKFLLCRSDGSAPTGRQFSVHSPLKIVSLVRRSSNFQVPKRISPTVRRAESCSTISSMRSPSFLAARRI
ncbi:hypothetical protein, partial [Rhizobium johnstonii]|uniref:hypothetical protein n=1 Tax=Rhizobium johnstonii TaxID=3019933 RepID=UPI003F9EA185